MYIETPYINNHMDPMYIETPYISSYMDPMYIETPYIHSYMDPMYIETLCTYIEESHLLLPISLSTRMLPPTSHMYLLPYLYFNQIQ